MADFSDNGEEICDGINPGEDWEIVGKDAELQTGDQHQHAHGFVRLWRDIPDYMVGQKVEGFVSPVRRRIQPEAAKADEE